MPARPKATEARILDVAERLVQVRGFNGFSYADVAAKIGITTASLHYHFPTKEALGVSLIARYTESFLRSLQEIATAGQPVVTLQRYVGLYESVLRKGRMCLCGMLAADYTTLPKEMREAVRTFFDRNEAWLAGVLEEGRRLGRVAFQGAPIDQARLVVGTLEGAMLVARTYDDPVRFTSSSARLLAALQPA